MTRRGPGWRPVDWIALALALALGSAIVLILVVSAIQVTHGSFPQVKLSDNATQIITAGMGGLTGLIGAYIGTSRHGADSEPRLPQAGDREPPGMTGPTGRTTRQSASESLDPPTEIL